MTGLRRFLLPELSDIMSMKPNRSKSLISETTDLKSRLRIFASS